MTKRIKLLALLIAASAPLVPVAAQNGAASASEAASEPKVSLTSDVLAIVTKTDASGAVTTTLAEPTEFTPGTKLSFGMNYANNGVTPATNVTGTNPLNAAVRLAPDADPSLIVSVDGGETFGTLNTLSVATQTQGTRPPTHADVTHVRWTIASIAPGESGRIAFPVIIR
ncbi:MAG: hypothetical protein AAFY19_02050 [Pseudomonadota bacterium]